MNIQWSTTQSAIELFKPLTALLEEALKACNQVLNNLVQIRQDQTLFFVTDRGATCRLSDPGLVTRLYDLKEGQSPLQGMMIVVRVRLKGQGRIVSAHAFPHDDEAERIAMSALDHLLEDYVDSK